VTAVVTLNAGSALAGEQSPSTPTPVRPSFDAASMRAIPIGRDGAIDFQVFLNVLSRQL
jgi:hypothetical protein